MNAKRTLRSIEEPTLDEEIEGVLAMTPEQRRAELEAAGFDMKELHAKADAWAEKKEPSRSQRPQVRSRPPMPERQRRPPVFWFAAATVAAAAAGGLVYALTHPGAPPQVPSPPAPSSAPAPELQSEKLIAASDLRRRALAACEASRWDACLSQIEEARMLDPAGDEAPEVKAARKKAVDEIDRKVKLKP